MVEVRNSTPEPDGSRRTYFLRVPPTMRTAREAVAWTFGLGAVDYRPAVETNRGDLLASPSSLYGKISHLILTG